jgi:hypothetical protein
MRSNRLWIGATCAVALALGAVAAVDAGTQTAGAQADSTVSPQQLKINQNISSAAVKRSNRSLNYLAPIRTTHSNGSNGGSEVVPEMQLWARLGKTGNITAQSGPASGLGSFTSSRKEPAADHPAGDYVVDFDIDVSACLWSASPFFPGPAGGAMFRAAVTEFVPGDPSKVRVKVFDIKAVAAADTTEEEAGALTDDVVGVQVLCAQRTISVTG